jgi:hypothetical protein
MDFSVAGFRPLPCGSEDLLDAGDGARHRQGEAAGVRDDAPRRFERFDGAEGRLLFPMASSMTLEKLP